MNNLKRKLRLYLDSNLIKTKRRNKFFNRVEGLFCEDYLENDIERNTNYYGMSKLRESNNSGIEAFIDKHEQYNDFQTMLFNFIDNKNLKDSDVYNKVHIDRRLFSKIRNDNYHPSKETIILLGLSLKLNIDEIIELLESASYSLPKNNHYDLIIRFCFIEGIYEIKDVNELLSMYGCKLFSY